jgi:hypothetical protein
VRWPRRRGLANLWAWLAADVNSGDIFFTASGGLAHLRAWLATDGDGDDAFLAAARGCFSNFVNSPHVKILSGISVTGISKVWCLSVVYIFLFEARGGI